MGENGEAVRKGPTITVEFDSLNSAIATLKTHDISYMQMFAAAKLIEVQGEGLLMQELLAQAQKGPKAGELVIPRIVPS